MRQVTVETVISAPREELFDFVGDLSRRPAIADHYLKDYRLARANPVGKGAAARFLLDAPVFSERGDIAIAEYERPRRIVEEGAVGRRGRSRLVAIWDFAPEAGGNTRVTLTSYSEPYNAVDRLRQRGAHRWVRRQTKKSLRRLKQIFEEGPRGELARVGVAGYDDFKAPRFGAHVPTGQKAGAADG